MTRESSRSVLSLGLNRQKSRGVISAAFLCLSPGSGGLLILYWIFLTWIIVFKMELTFGGLPHRRSLNLIPLGASVIVNGELDFSEIIQNALAFIPFGVLMHALWEEKTVLKQMLPIVGTSLLFPRATSQADMLACPFGDCCEGQMPRSLLRGL